VECDFDRFLVQLRQIFNNWKKIEEHVRIRGKKTIHHSFQPILERIKVDTVNFTQILEGVAVFVDEEVDKSFINHSHHFSQEFPSIIANN